MRSLFVLLLLFTLLPLCADAQSSLSLALQVQPQFPEAGETYTVSLKNTSFFGARTNVEWFVNGTEQTEAEGQTEITLQAADTPTRVTARVLSSSGEVRETTTTISPYRIDLIINANTQVPDFYRGRTLPSNGSTITAKALVFKDSEQMQSGLSYAWRVGNSVQQGGAITGGNTFTYTPQFEDRVLLSVDVLNAHGDIIARESRYIDIVEPEIYFYEKNPLRGVLPLALRNPHLMIGDEMMLRAEAFYITEGLSQSAALREWKIDGTKTEASTDPHEITLRKEGGDGSATVSFQIRNLKNLLQGVMEEITIKF